MRWLVISFLLLFIPNSLVTNELNINYFDNNEYLENHNTASFFESKLADKVIDLENIDEELINATLFFYLNKKRTKGRRKAFRGNESLFQTCKNFVDKYSGSSFKSFKKKKSRFERSLKKNFKLTNFKGTYFNGSCDYVPLLKMSKKKKYVYDENFNDGEDLFFFKKKKRKQELKPIEIHTYLSLAESIFKRTNFNERNASISGKQYSELGCFISVVRKNKKRIPFVEVIWVVGGYRLGQS